MQQGTIALKHGAWYLRYRENATINGQLVRKEKWHKLATKSDRYRSASDLDDLIAEKMLDVRQVEKCPAAGESFVDFVEKVYFPWLAENKKPSTRAGYSSYWRRYIRPRVTQYAVRDFEVAIVSRVLGDIAASFEVNVDTLTKCRNILSAIFKYAMATGAYPGKSKAHNPASGALVPKARVEKQETHAASLDELRAILGHLNKEGKPLAYAAVACVGYLGVRPSEARGLKWSDWNRQDEHIHVQRGVWHAIEGTLKTRKSARFVPVIPELRTILMQLWKSQGSPIDGYVLARASGSRVNLDNEARRAIVPALSACAVCGKPKDEKHDGHTYARNENLPEWRGWYSFRRMVGTEVEDKSASVETASAGLGNSPAVMTKHYSKPKAPRQDVRKAYNAALSGLTA
jgi:integrase